MSVSLHFCLCTLSREPCACTLAALGVEYYADTRGMSACTLSEYGATGGGLGEDGKLHFLRSNSSPPSWWQQLAYLNLTTCTAPATFYDLFYATFVVTGAERECAGYEVGIG